MLEARPPRDVELDEPPLRDMEDRVIPLGPFG